MLNYEWGCILPKSNSELVRVHCESAWDYGICVEFWQYVRHAMWLPTRRRNNTTVQVLRPQTMAGLATWLLIRRFNTGNRQATRVRKYSSMP